MSDWRAGLDDEERSLPRDPVGWYKKYGVTFRDVYPGDLPLLRHWRNHPDIRRFMIFRGEITEQMQEAWFESLDRDRERYSVLEFHGERIGLTQLRHIDARDRTAEGGITIWHPDHQNGLLSYRVSLAGMDWDFLECGYRRLDVSVLGSNARARRFVRSLGYRLEPSRRDGDDEILRGSVTPASYFSAVKPWREIIRHEMIRLREPFPIGV